MDRTLKAFRRILLCFFFSFANTYAQDNGHAKPGFTMGALGDSVTTATNASGLGSKPQYSWATGKGTPTRSFQSHFKRLEKIKRNGVKAYNMAKGGARAKDIPRQAEKLAKKKVDYATILIGANDLCDWRSSNQRQLDQYEKDVRTSIDTLIKSNRNMKILLLPVPDMYNLWKINNQRKLCILPLHYNIRQVAG